MEPLLGQQQARHRGAATDPPIQGRTWRVLRHESPRRQKHPGSIRMDGHDDELAALRAVVFRRWRQDLGSQLDHRSDARQSVSRRAMKKSPLTFAAACLAVLMGSMTSAQSTHDGAKPPQDADLIGLHDFDFLVGQWRVHHRLLKDRLADSHEWTEFEGSL